MKQVSQMIGLAMAALAVVGCVREENDIKDVPQMTIRAEIPDEPLTKASFSVPEEGTGLHLAWQAGDDIRVISGSNSAVYTIQPGFTDHVATFSGPVVPGETFDVICPGSPYESVEAAQAGNAALTQDGNGSTAHLVFTARLSGVSKGDLPNLCFSTDWVSRHPGTSFNRGGIVKFVLTLPNAVTTPKKVVMTGIGDKEISVNLTNVSTASNHVLTAYAQCGWTDIPIAKWDEFTVGVLDEDGSFYAATNQIKTNGVILKAGAQNSITITSGFTERLFSGGDGTEGNPYLIASAKQLDNMHAEGVLKHQERVYFRLIDDIDMASYLSSNRWIPLNAVNPYDYLIDFDGDGHTIDHFSCSYNKDTDNTTTQKDPSFFGVLYGSCHDVTFTNATITCNEGPCGILGGYIGYSAKKADVYNVHVKGSVTKGSGGGTNGVGGMAGIIAYSYIDSCSADVEVSSNTDFSGVMFGRDSDDASRIRNCWTAGSIYGQQKVGGLIGGIIRPESEVINCFSTATVNATRFSGGLIGDACLDAGSSNHWKSAETLQPDNVVKGCIAWQTLLRTRDQGGIKDGWGSGAIIGFTATHNYLMGCMRNSAMVLDDFSDELVLYDQNDANPDSPLVINNPRPGTYKHYFPYHGKAYSGTLSACARILGWDETVWDLSGSVPVLTGAVEAEPVGEEPISGQPDVEALSVSQGSLARAFPGTTSALGSKSATQDGITWTVTEVAEGIRYFHAAGKVSAGWMDSGSRNQELHVIDYDLSNTDYEVKIVHSSPTCVASQVFEATGALATINAGYEIASIAVKANTQYTWEKNDASQDNSVLNNIKPGSERVIHYPAGIPKSYIPNNTIHWETKDNSGNVIAQGEVPNWKSEGAFYCDGHQGVRIAFDGYDGGATDKYGNNALTKTVQQERRWFRMGTENEAGFVSSAPIIDANYVRFGYTFKDRHPKESGEPSEAPNSHQSQAAPRTAVAIAYPDGDNEAPHLLLIVVDGRYADGYGGFGYSAYWLERHIANAFGPKYMLNLDGGGSSTMCVRLDEYEDYNYVVNYPCDNRGSNNRTHDHAGQRARDTFICIVPSED